MINFIFALLFSFFHQIEPQPESIYCFEQPHDTAYVGFIETYSGGLIDKDALDTATMSFRLPDVVGIEVDWYDPQFDNFTFLTERAIYTTDGEMDYLYFYSDGSKTLVYVMDVIVPDNMGNEHGCGAFLVTDIDWLTE